MPAVLIFISGAALVLWGVGTFSIPAAAILAGLMLIWIATQLDPGAST